MKAILKNYRQSPRKVRLVADLIRGRGVKEAGYMLSFSTKRAAKQISKLLKSAIANAKENFDKEDGKLYVKEIRVDDGPTLHRWRPRARGSAFAIKKRSSHVKIVLDEKE